MGFDRPDESVEEKTSFTVEELADKSDEEIAEVLGGTKARWNLYSDEQKAESVKEARAEGITATEESSTENFWTKSNE